MGPSKRREQSHLSTTPSASVRIHRSVNSISWSMIPKATDIPEKTIMDYRFQTIIRMRSLTGESSTADMPHPRLKKVKEGFATL